MPALEEVIEMYLDEDIEKRAMLEGAIRQEGERVRDILSGHIHNMLLACHVGDVPLHALGLCLTRAGIEMFVRELNDIEIPKKSATSITMGMVSVFARMTVHGIYEDEKQQGVESE